MSPAKHAIDGCVDDRFQAVADTFRDNFRKRRELGAAVAVYVQGEKVVDLWGGLADAKRRTPWAEDTLGIMFSSTKGVVATAFLMLADRGILDYDERVAHYWPEFESADKGGVTVRQLLSHRAGLHGLDLPVDLAAIREDRVADALASQAPAWAPGSDQGYHGVTFGLYTAELFRRLTGETLGAFVRREISEPLGLDLWLGLPEALEERVARLYPVGPRDLLLNVVPRLIGGRGQSARAYRAALRRRSPTARAFAVPTDLGAKQVRRFDSREVRALELPWANALGTARSLAQMYSNLLGCDRAHPSLVSPGATLPLRTRQSWATPDRVVMKPMGFSQGFVKEETHLFSPHPESFGHPGAGGVLGWADPIENVAIAYIPNRMDFRIRSPRAIALAHSVYAALGVPFEG